MWPPRPRPRPRPAPARSLPSRRRGRGRGPGRRAPGSAGPLPFPARQFPALPARPPAGCRGRAAAASAPRPVTDFPARSGRAAPAPRTNHSQATAGRPGGLAAASRPAARPLPAAGSPAAGSMVGSGRAARSEEAATPAARPGPARLRSALRPPLYSRPPSFPPSPPGGPGRESGAARGVGLSSPPAGPASGSPCLPPSLPLPLPAPFSPRAASPSRSPAPASDALSPTFARGSLLRDPATPPRRAPGGRLPGLRAAGAPRRADSGNAASPPGPSRRRPAVPLLARAPRTGAAPGSPAGPRLGTPRGKDWNRISRLPGGGGGRGLGRLAPTCSEVHGAGGRAGRARLLSRRLAEWEGEPRLRRSFNNPIRQAHSQVFFARFRIFFFFSVWDILQTFFF